MNPHRRLHSTRWVLAAMAMAALLPACEDGSDSAQPTSEGPDSVESESDAAVEPAADSEDSSDSSPGTESDSSPDSDANAPTPDIVEVPIERFEELCNWPEIATSLECGEPTAVELETPPELVAFTETGGDGAVVAWASGSSLHALRVDADGTPTGEVQSTEVEGPISGLAAANSDEMTMVVYSVGRIAEDPQEDVVLRFRPVAGDGAIGESVFISDNFELKPGGVPTDVGPRFWGLMNEVTASKTYVMAGLALLNHDGSVRTVHVARVFEEFEYFEIHASDLRSNYPYVLEETREVSYYDQSIHALSCGLPLIPALVVPEGGAMAATEFWNLQALWVFRDVETCEGTGSGFAVFHDTSSKSNDIRELGFAPSELMDVAVRQQGGDALIVDEVGGELVTVRTSMSTQDFWSPSKLPVAGQASALTAQPTDEGWLILREQLSGTSPRLEIHALCE